jgi:hypothetical protein
MHDCPPTRFLLKEICREDVLKEFCERCTGREDSNLRPHGPETCNLTVRLLRCDHIYQHLSRIAARHDCTTLRL